MQHDEPTISNQGQSAPGADMRPGPTPEPRVPGGAPIWPGGEYRSWREAALSQAPRGYVSSAAFAISLGTNVVLLIGLLGMLLFGHGILTSGGSAGPSTRGVAAHSQAVSSPTATASPAPSSATGSGWLQVAPSKTQLGCADGQRTQFVVLENTGSDSVQWQAVFSGPAEQAGVTVSPPQGELAAGASMPLQLQNRTNANGQQGASDQQGVIAFTATTSDAGPPANLTYIASGCD